MSLCNQEMRGGSKVFHKSQKENRPRFQKSLDSRASETTKGQKISKKNFGVSNFPKKTQY